MNSHPRIAGLALAVIGCTSIQVQPLDTALRPEYICIEENPAVQVSDFVQVVQERLLYHGIRSSVVFAHESSACDFVLTYTARRSWDLTPYLSHAEVYISHDGRRVANGTFQLRGKGGYALTKYRGTREQMNPVIDQLVGAVSLEAEPD